MLYMWAELGITRYGKPFVYQLHILDVDFNIILGRPYFDDQIQFSVSETTIVRFLNHTGQKWTKICNNVLRKQAGFSFVIISQKQQTQRDK